jgi:hypothetical protein
MKVLFAPSCPDGAVLIAAVKECRVELTYYNTAILASSYNVITLKYDNNLSERSKAGARREVGKRLQSRERRER